MRKLWNKIMNNKLLTLSILFFLGTVIFAQGCAPTIATIHLPDGKIAKYVGPKKVSMSLKENGREVKYSGLSEPWWASILAIFTGAASRAAQGGSETNINLSP